MPRTTTPRPAALRLLYCHECKRVRTAEAHLDPAETDPDRVTVWACRHCGGAILCDECGGDWSSGHELAHEQNPQLLVKQTPTTIPGPSFDNGAGATCETRLVADGSRWIAEERWVPACAPATPWQPCDSDAHGFMSPQRAIDALVDRWNRCDADGLPGFDADRWPEVEA